MAITVGLPRTHKEAEERRDFLPSLVRHLTRLGAADVVIEQGYGSRMGVSIEPYLEVSGRVRVASRDECLEQDVVLVLRCPDGPRENMFSFHRARLIL